MHYGPAKEVEIFKSLNNLSAYKAGLKYGFDRVYKDNRAVRNAVMNIYNKVKNNPDKYGVSQEVVDMVEKAMMERKTNLVGHNHTAAMVEKDEKRDIRELVQSIRDKTFGLIDKKIDRVANSKKKLDSLSFKDLGIIAGIAFDKTQILKGEATENIAVVAKIDGSLTPDDALKLALQNREKNVEVNTGKG